MRLRDHPLMSYRKCLNWPPAWMWIGGMNDHRPKGEIGILQEMVHSTTAPGSRCFLVVEHRNAIYMGALLFDDPAFCGQVYALLQDQIGQPISSIGDLEVGHLL
ncbi:MAG TPA: hypothetical protein VGL11_06835 [Candidatus Binatia bacterium]|jgi:hypothetical protein